MHNKFTEPLKEKLKEALQAVLPIMGLVLVLCFSVAPISSSILLCFLLGGAAAVWQLAKANVFTVMTGE